MNKVEKMGQEDVSSIVNKYLDQSASKVSNVIAEVNFSKFKETDSAGKEFAIMKLKNGQVIKLEEDSMLYEKLQEFARSNFLRINAERFINPSEISEFLDIDRSIDYSTKDITKEVVVEDQSWKAVFGDEE